MNKVGFIKLSDVEKAIAIKSMLRGQVKINFRG